MTSNPFTVAIVGAGPSGLFAAEHLARTGVNVHVFEQKPTPARKFLMAGRGGLNITHSEDFDLFQARYGAAESFLSPALNRFSPDGMRAWCHGLEQETFIGSSGRVFPTAMKASPLLRAWLSRLESLGVHFHYRHTWRGWDAQNNLVFDTETGNIAFKSDATLLALGGASWPSLGSDGAWAKILKKYNVDIASFEPANCGFHVTWSPHMIQKFAGKPLKSIALSHNTKTVKGEIIITEKGVEGGAIYALSSSIRNDINENGKTAFSIDLKPSLSIKTIEEKLTLKPKGKQSFSTWLQKSIHLSPLSIALLYEIAPDISKQPIQTLAALIKALPIHTSAPFSLDRAISSAGGLPLKEIDESYMISKLPGVFVAGEMLDWEAPTGGYLLQACFATGKAAATGILNWRKAKNMA